MGARADGRLPLRVAGHLLGADLVKNEITCQLRGAVEIAPDVDTIFEIGGQDSGAFAQDNGLITGAPEAPVIFLMFYSLQELCAPTVPLFLLMLGSMSSKKMQGTVVRKEGTNNEIQKCTDYTITIVQIIT